MKSEVNSFDASDIQTRIATQLAPFGALFGAFEKRGFAFYAVGGCVRDWVLGKIPKDIDFTTDAAPEEIKATLAENDYRVIAVGEEFGTIATVIKKQQYEITTFRVKESYTRGSRHPVVCYGHDLALDLERRDLTINAMAASADGTLIDPFHGICDLQSRILRVPMSSYPRSCDIFSDDPLRILRLARFKARLGFTVDMDATKAARDLAGSVLTVSHERWLSEMDGLLNAENPAQGIGWLAYVGVLQLILPEICIAFSKKLQPTSLSGGKSRECAKTLWQWIIETIDAVPASHDLRWCAMIWLLGYGVTQNGAWADSVSKLLVFDITARFKMSSARSESIIKSLTTCPAGFSDYRRARELAMILENAIPHWTAFQYAKLAILPPAVREDEAARLKTWADALSAYENGGAQIILPKDLSRRIMDVFHVSGKTLGLYIARCKDAVLSQMLNENDETDAFVDYLQKDAASPVSNE